MHAQRATNFIQLAAIEIVGSEDEALLRVKLGQRGIDGGIHARVGQRDLFNLPSCKLRAAFLLFIQANEARVRPKAIHEFLCEHGPEPALKRSASAIGRELGDTLAIANGRSVQVSIKAVGEFAATAFIASDCVGYFVEPRAKAREEDFPGVLVARGAAMCKGEIFNLQAAQKLRRFRRTGIPAAARLNPGKDLFECSQRQPVLPGASPRVQLLINLLRTHKRAAASRALAGTKHDAAWMVANIARPRLGL